MATAVGVEVGANDQALAREVNALWMDDELEMLDSLHILAPLVKGGNAWVYQAVDQELKPVAVKVFRENCPRAATEVGLHALCHHHPHIAPCLDFVRSGAISFLVMQVAPEGDLFDRVVDVGPYAEADAAHVLAQVVSAVAFLHRHGIAHRDIKPENILMASATSAKLCDFGFAVRWSNGDALRNDSAGTSVCWPPEMHQAREYSPFALDVWCIGVVMFYLLTGLFPFEEDARGTVRDKVCSMAFDCPLPSNLSPEAKQALHAMLNPNPSTRASAKELQMLPFFRKAAHQAHASM